MNKDDNPRELIGVVTLMNGDQVEVRMPMMADLLDPSVIGRPPFEVMIESSTGMKIEDFKNLNVVDGTKILQKLNNSITAVMEYMSANTDQLKKLN